MHITTLSLCLPLPCSCLHVTVVVGMELRRTLLSVDCCLVYYWWNVPGHSWCRSAWVNSRGRLVVGYGVWPDLCLLRERARGKGGVRRGEEWGCVTTVWEELHYKPQQFDLFDSAASQVFCLFVSVVHLCALKRGQSPAHWCFRFFPAAVKHPLGGLQGWWRLILSGAPCYLVPFLWSSGNLQCLA